MRKHLQLMTFSLPLGKTGRECRINLFLLVVFIGMIWGFTQLGLWQLSRADEKRLLLAEFEKNQIAQRVDLNTQSIDVVEDYRSVQLTGRWLEQLTVYIANEPHNARDGYHVLHPVLFDENKVIWVNRGWIAALPDRRFLPDIEPVPEWWSLKGTAYYFKGEPILFDHAIREVSKNQWLIQGRDQALLQQALGTRNVASIPFIIRLADDDPYRMAGDWQIIAMPADKHIAYAVQWFGLATAAMIIGLLISIKKRNEQ